MTNKFCLNSAKSTLIIIIIKSKTLSFNSKVGLSSLSRNPKHDSAKQKPPPSRYGPYSIQRCSFDFNYQLAQIWPELGVKFHTLNFGPNFNQYGLMCRLKRTRVSKGEVSFIFFFFCVLVYNCRLDENETIEACKIKIHSKYTRLL